MQCKHYKNICNLIMIIWLNDHLIVQKKYFFLSIRVEYQQNIILMINFLEKVFYQLTHKAY